MCFFSATLLCCISSLCTWSNSAATNVGAVLRSSRLRFLLHWRSVFLLHQKCEILLQAQLDTRVADSWRFFAKSECFVVISVLWAIPTTTDFTWNKLNLSKKTKTNTKTFSALNCDLIPLWKPTTNVTFSSMINRVNGFHIISWFFQTWKDDWKNDILTSQKKLKICWKAFFLVGSHFSKLFCLSFLWRWGKNSYKGWWRGSAGQMRNSWQSMIKESKV